MLTVRQIVAPVVAFLSFATGCQTPAVPSEASAPSPASEVSTEAGAAGERPDAPARMDLSQLTRYAELQRLYRRRVEARRRALRDEAFQIEHGSPEMMPVVGTAAAMNFASTEVSAMAFDSASLESMGMTPSLEIAEDASITNNQERGVDEGDIVKRIGRFLIVLRRGRLYSFEILEPAGRGARRVDSEPVYPFWGEHQAWYDEILVLPGKLIVLGYAYENESTELAVFEIDDRGRLSHDETYVLRSSDYFSGENYGARLVGERLVLHMPISIDQARLESVDHWLSYATLGRWGQQRDWRPLLGSMELVAPPASALPSTVHVVVSCAFESDRLECRGRGFFGGWQEEHYVTPDAAYVWTSLRVGPSDVHWSTRDEMESWVDALDPRALDRLEGAGRQESIHRIPFDPAEPVGRVALEGEPLNQFSFRARDGHLDLLVSRRGETWGELERRQWIRLGLDRFAEADASVTSGEIVELPSAFVSGWCSGNRFIGERLLYASCRDDRNGDALNGLYAVELDRDATATWIETEGTPARIERVASRAVVVSEAPGEYPGGGLDLGTILLDGEPAMAASLRVAHHVELENRSHAFNWTTGPAAEASGAYAVFAIPASEVDPASKRERRFEFGHSVWTESVFDSKDGISYFAMGERGGIDPIGRLVEDRDPDAGPEECEVSCVDWYGSIRPFFIGKRGFALLGEELVEGEFAPGRIVERWRGTLSRW